MWVEARSNIYNIAERLDHLEEPFMMDVEREVHSLCDGGGGEAGKRGWGLESSWYKKA